MENLIHTLSKSEIKAFSSGYPLLAAILAEPIEIVILVV